MQKNSKALAEQSKYYMSETYAVTLSRKVSKLCYKMADIANACIFLRKARLKSNAENIGTK